MEIGVTSFADVPDGGDAAKRLRELVEEIELADAVGLDAFGVGEHHRPDFAVSAPAVALAAAATRTRRIRLSSAVTVLSTDDPVRVFEQFATLDGLSGGRAEIIGVYPRPVQQPLPVWIGVGGTPASVVRAGLLGLPLTIAIIGGEPARFVEFADLYREALRRGGHDAEQAQVAINSHAHLAADAQQAADEMWPSYATVLRAIELLGTEVAPRVPEALAVAV